MHENILKKPWNEPHSKWFIHYFTCGCELESTKVIEYCPSHPNKKVEEIISDDYR